MAHRQIAPVQPPIQRRDRQPGHERNDHRDRQSNSQPIQEAPRQPSSQPEDQPSDQAIEEPLTDEERLILLHEDGMSWKEVANRIQMELGITYSKSQLIYRHRRLRSKVYPADNAITDAKYSCLKHLYDNEEFRKSTLTKTFALLRQINLQLKAWKLGQIMWDTNACMDDGTMTGGCAVVQIQPDRALDPLCKALATIKVHTLV
jgi:hypothetical protein